MTVGIRKSLVWIAPVVAVGIVPGAAASQDWDWCNERDRGSTYCEVREYEFASDGDLVIDGGMNGGIAVTGWDRDDVRVEARVWTRGGSDERAEELAAGIDVLADDDLVEARGPRTRSREGWAVSYRVYVPARTDLSLETHNGGITISEVEGQVRFSALNGGVNLAGVSGDVVGHTTNGGLHIELTGAEWVGEGLDVETTNGGVVVAIPERYSAELETGTVNGGFSFDIPVTVRGKIGRRVRSTLGDGGAPVRAVTTNGGVRVIRARGELE